MALDEVVPARSTSCGTGGQHRRTIPDDLPLVAADPALLERVVANLVANALRYSPPAGVRRC